MFGRVSMNIFSPSAHAQSESSASAHRSMKFFHLCIRVSIQNCSVHPSRVAPSGFLYSRMSVLFADVQCCKPRSRLISLASCEKRSSPWSLRPSSALLCCTHAAHCAVTPNLALFRDPWKSNYFSDAYRFLSISGDLY